MNEKEKTDQTKSVHLKKIKQLLKSFVLDIGSAERSNSVAKNVMNRDVQS
jgi:hypothetical protein